MSTAQIREELHAYINHADERILNLMYGMMKADREEEPLTAGQQKELEKRIARHKDGESKSYGWSEARSKIERRT